MMAESFIKSWKGILILFLFMGWMIHSDPSDLRAARTDLIEKDITQKKKDLKDVKKELSLTKEKEKKIQGQETSILESLHAIEIELYDKEEELKQMEARLERTKERLQQAKDQIATLNREMEWTKEELFSRLVALYKMGRTPPEAILLTSESYLDLLRIDKFLKVIINFDSRLIDTYRYQVALKSRYQEELTKEQFQWERHISDVEQKKKEIERVRRTKRALLKSIKNQKSVYQKVIDELQERAKELQTLIVKLEREKHLLAYRKSKHDTIKGKLIPPIQGKVISLFKERGQNGIEIQAPMGAQIRAVLPGKVLYADWFKGFGNVVIIDHGDHTFTIYGYGSELLKKEGDIVSQGETIALVGSSGSLKGPCLYFEIRYQGKPQDPTQWISHLDKVVSLPKGNENGKM
jgi:septal ring factor EnvC (AmiA/AmiB activator)